MDKQTKVIGGMPEEIVRNLASRRAIRNKAADGETGPWDVCTETTKLIYDDLVIHSGVKLLLHTTLVDVIRDQDNKGTRVIAAIVESKSGRHAIEADTFIDCTGDADLIRRTDLPTQLGNATHGCQPPSLCFRVAGVEDGIALNELQSKLFKEPMDYNGQPYPCFLWGTKGLWDDNERMLAAVRVPRINAADTHDLTKAEVHGRYQLRWIMSQLQKYDGWKNIHLVDIATQIGVRETHRIISDHMLSRMEVLTGHQFEDTIAQGTYPIDIHNPDGPGIAFEEINGLTRAVHGDGSRSQGRWDGEADDAPVRDTLCWNTPYRSLIPKGLNNVLVAGRCIGADHDAAGAIRVMINAMQFGQAAGAAAALSNGADMRTVTGDKLRETLKAQDVPLL